MKQTTKRIIAMLLTVVMLISSLSVFTFATNNYTPDEEYYTEIIRDALVVNPAWAGYTDGMEIEYYFRNEVYGSTSTVINKYDDPEELANHYEKFDKTIHYSNINDAMSYCKDNNIANPVIVLCPGVYSDTICIEFDVTILGANAGIDPNVSSNDGSAWAINPEMLNYTSIAGKVELNKFIEKDIEVVFDGVKFINGFVYYEAGATQFGSSVVIRNSVMDGIAAPVVDRTELSSVFYFERATTKTVSVTFEKVRAERISATLIGNYVADLNISDSYFGDCTASIVDGIDAMTGTSPEYLIKDSMFYNNVTEDGILSFDHSLKDSSTRTKSSLEISGCKFIAGPENANNAEFTAITYVVAGAKNAVNIHDCEFIADTDQLDSPLNLKYASAALTGTISDSVYFNSNKLIGFTTLNDTTGLLKQSKLDFTGNYYADSEGNQVSPVYPSSSSYNNIILDYYWIDSEMTVPSDIYYITDVGVEDFKVKNDYKTLYITLEQDTVLNLNFKTADKSTKYTVYSDAALTTPVESVDSSLLYTGEGKNVYYAVGKSSKAPDYSFVYTVYISTYNPDLAAEFDLVNTYMYAPEVKDLEYGTEICKDWDGTSYRFVVGENVFATTKEIFDIAYIPTIIIPAGIYTEDFCISESATILGAKHGINPNIPDFENFESGWEINPERSNPDNETVFEGCAVYIATPSIDVKAEIDGITLGEGSSFYDIGDKVETHTTTTLRNILINNAGGAELKEKDANGADVVRSSGNVLNFGGTSEDFSNNHKDVRLINIRMENQSTYYLLGTYMESLLIDGLYFAGSSKRIHNSELTSPKTQNFKLEVRNSFFYRCTPSNGGGIICVTNKETDTPEREYNKVIYDHNLFYEPSTYIYGVIGIRFFSSRDSFYFTNNTVISTYAGHSLMPGNAGWFTGSTACENLSPDQIETAETVTDVIIKFNRICGPYKPVDKQNVKYDTCWDYSGNYVCDLDKETVVGGNFEGGIFDRTTPGIQMTKYSDTQKNYMKCDYYFSDWDMTNMVNAPDSFKTELDYTFNGEGEFEEISDNNYTYTDSVEAGTNTYTFNIKLNTQQASYGVYSDVDCTNKLSDTVVLDKNINEFYIKFASYKDTVIHLYKATITKELSSEAELIELNNYSISDNTVTAIVPIGTTTVLLNNIKLSDGATYKIFNDQAKTKEFHVTKIENISAEPIYKYIEVTSEDGSTVTDYEFSIKQGISNLADITAIDGAVKVDDTTFEATIPVDSASFDLIATISDGATLSVSNEGKDVVLAKNQVYTIHNVGNFKAVDLTVTAENGDEKTFTLCIFKDTSNTEISYIFNMYNNGDDKDSFYTQVNTSEFELIPVFKNPYTSYELYTDAECTQPYEYGVIYLEKETTVIYLKAISADGSASKVYTLIIKTTDPNAEPDIPVNPDGPDVEFDITQIFTDVVKDSWYEPFVAYAYLFDLFDGTSETTFDPQGKMTRAQFVRVLANLEGVELDNNVTTEFTDVESGKWYTGAIKWAHEIGMVDGVGDNKFAPNDPITREQMCVILVNLVENHYETTLSEEVEPITFADDASISSWAKESVYKCQRAGIVSGVGDNKFNPRATTTRAEAATVFSTFHLIWLILVSSSIN